MRWLSLIRPGDWLIIVVGLASCVAAFPLAWQAGQPEKAIVRQAALDAAKEEIAIARKGLIEADKPLLKEISGLGVTVISNIVDARTGAPYAPARADLPLGRRRLRVVGIGTNSLNTYPAASRPDRKGSSE